MKKYLAVAAVVALVALGAPAFAATNPFMDVPINHWSYDAIGQLAARGVLSGYPDGTYKGKQPTTRYEMASALARALAVVDMTKASKQDVEMLKKLVVEFKDELDALGVQVEEIDGRLGVIEERLGGWKIGGQLRLDIDYDKYDPEDVDGDGTSELATADGTATLGRARVFFERFFGEDESLHFFGRLDITSVAGTTSNAAGNAVRWETFYADMPFFGDSRLYAGRFIWDMENAYYYVSVVDGMQEDSPLTDRRVDG
ncbi:MAG: S-layer homology domain-containing protein, partial [Synergistaceae bacterium]|nr:S-layer homology domain-containing protein [Synergistaceae bacterium]